ncbi:MAG: cache domain-containing protein [Xanthobacteraceae bacterium]|nr:cache domain-containing protein [Xanthobacteraceae bacterium]
MAASTDAIDHAYRAGKASGLTITRRLTLMVGMAGLLIVLMLVVNALNTRASIVEDRKAAVRNQVETVVSMVRGLVAAAKAGKISEAEAKERAKAAIRTMRYGKGDYFFAIDYDGISTAHALKPELEGTNLLDSKDSEGVAYTPLLIRAAKDGGGYVPFKFSRAGSAEPQPKIAYALGIDDWRWLIGSGVYIDDIDAAFRDRLMSSSLWALGILAVLALCGWVIAQGLVRPVRSLTAAMTALAAGDTSVAVPAMDRRDEIGGMARTVDVFKRSMIDSERMRSEQDRQKQAAAVERKRDLDRIAQEFEGAVGAIINTVSSSAAELEASAGTLTTTATGSQDLATRVASASEEASANVQSVASATEEMTASVNEISRQVQDSARIAGEAVAQVRATTDRVGDLSKAAARIGDVVDLINSIAAQTNLLALNATIEAARAGDAGRGFAVVAQEVKSLAEQTAKATGDISEQIAGIQNATRESVDAIGAVDTVIGRLAEIASTIAAAVEEQGAATREIARNVQQAARGTQQVSGNVADVQRGAEETGTASSRVLSAAQSLAVESTQLKQQVNRFLATVRAA